MEDLYCEGCRTYITKIRDCVCWKYRAVIEFVLGNKICGLFKIQKAFDITFGNSWAFHKRMEASGLIIREEDRIGFVWKVSDNFKNREFSP